ncbi:MAG TPA: ferritin-like domain-containing protein [Gemmatimonadaceae bacterium]|jgi:hypothetical protein|nr:ferritin-like domain-containing protein [Gemmatimonadaceae bacterium]
MTGRSDRHIEPTPSAVLTPTPLASGTKSIEEAKLPALPPKPEEMSWRDYLIMLLHIAAELEHGLMVEYLYAAYSLGGAGAAEHSGMVTEWRDVILTVAREEMGHLVTVQNLLLLIGGPVSFERQDFPWSSPFYPFDFKLEPLSLESLACYVYAEMPKDLTRPVDLKTQHDVNELVTGDKPTVGEIYDRIIRLVGDRKLIPDSTFDPESYRYQATWDEWGRGYRPGAHKPYAKSVDTPAPYERKTRVIVTQMATRTEALAALRDVAGQGEAEHVRATDKMEDSHFDRFAKIFRSYKRIRSKDAKWSPSRPVPENPFAGEARYAPDGATAITSKASMAWASLFNIRYRMLLSMLTYMYRIPRDAPESSHLRRAGMLGRIFGEMYNLKAVAGILVRLPLGDRKDPARAGPPFQMPYTLSPPLPEANFWRMHLDLLGATATIVDMLLDPARDNLADAPADGRRYLLALRDADADARSWIEEILVGMDASRRTRA